VRCTGIRFSNVFMTSKNMQIRKLEIIMRDFTFSKRPKLHFFCCVVLSELAS
jgi:hypothetical protein